VSYDAFMPRKVADILKEVKPDAPRPPRPGRSHQPRFVEAMPVDSDGYGQSPEIEVEEPLPVASLPVDGKDHRDSVILQQGKTIAALRREVNELRQRAAENRRSVSLGAPAIPVQSNGHSRWSPFVVRAFREVEQDLANLPPGGTTPPKSESWDGPIPSVQRCVALILDARKARNGGKHRRRILVRAAACLITYIARSEEEACSQDLRSQESSRPLV
jgi:hypothetical protein